MVSILVIGNEILSGSVQDLNLAYMFRRFREMSIPVEEVRIVPDDIDMIVSSIRELSGRSDFLITSGGIGPTHDDVTLAAFARFHVVEIVENADMKKRVETYFGEDIREGHRYLYRVPANTEMIGGTAEKWPVFKIGNAFVLPGLPEIFKLKFDMVLQALPTARTIHRRALGVKVGEGYFAEELEKLQGDYPDVEIGSYPSYLGSWDKEKAGSRLAVKITFASSDEERLQACYKTLRQTFEARDWVFPLLDSAKTKRVDAD